MAKTVIVPLWQYTDSEVRRRIQLEAPLWGGVNIAAAAKYLGLFVGPGKKEHSWKGPIRKYLDRSAQWGKRGLGLPLTLPAYQTYIVTVLRFVAQLEDLPADFEVQEQKATRAFGLPTGLRHLF